MHFSRTGAELADCDPVRPTVLRIAAQRVLPFDARRQPQVDVTAGLPSLSFLRVPESKVAKNRVHLDLPVSGGRHVPQEQREPLIREAAERLTAAGATVAAEHFLEGELDHIEMLDPEGNEFCLL